MAEGGVDPLSIEISGGWRDDVGSTPGWESDCLDVCIPGSMLLLSAAMTSASDLSKTWSTCALIDGTRWYPTFCMMRVNLSLVTWHVAAESYKEAFFCSSSFARPAKSLFSCCRAV
jgi:hypothetical protein